VARRRLFPGQHVDLDDSKGIEIIGYDASSQDCTSHYFDNAGNVLTYTYDVGDDTLTIWGGRRGSSAAFKGKISSDRNTAIGHWEWPETV
jgi:hypothetical protein